MTKPKAALFHDYPPSDGVVFSDAVRTRLAGMTTLYPEIVNAANFDRHAPHLADLEVIFATWGMINFSLVQKAIPSRNSSSNGRTLIAWRCSAWRDRQNSVLSS